MYSGLGRGTIPGLLWIWSAVTFNPFRCPFPHHGKFSDTEVLISTQLHTQLHTKCFLGAAPSSTLSLISSYLDFSGLFGFMCSTQRLCWGSPGFPLPVSQPGNYLKLLSWGRCRTHFLCLPSLRITFYLLDNCCFILFCMGFNFVSVFVFGCFS